MLNDPFVHEQARAFAARIQKERSGDAPRIERAYALSLGRAPTSEEAAASLEYVRSTRAQLDEKQAWESFARILFRLNEFVYVR
jgi:hypothetical protein